MSNTQRFRREVRLFSEAKKRETRFHRRSFRRIRLLLAELSLSNSRMSK
jgi:hypothetical protein